MKKTILFTFLIIISLNVYAQGEPEKRASALTETMTEALSLNKANDYLYDLINGKASLGKKSLLELHSLIMEGSNEEGGILMKNALHRFY